MYTINQLFRIMDSDNLKGEFLVIFHSKILRSSTCAENIFSQAIFIAYYFSTRYSQVFTKIMRSLVLA